MERALSLLLLGSCLALFGCAAPRRNVSAGTHIDAAESGCTLRLKELALAMKYDAICTGQFPGDLLEFQETHTIPAECIRCPSNETLFLYVRPDAKTADDLTILWCPIHTNHVYTYRVLRPL